MRLPRLDLARHGSAAVLAAGLAIALLVGIAIDELRQATARAAGRIQLVTSIDEQNAELNAILWEAFATGTASPETRTRARERLRAFVSLESELEADDSAGSALHDDAEEYVNRVRSVIDALDRGDNGLALVDRGEEVATVFSGLEDGLEVLADREERRAEVTRRVARLATFTILLLAALASWALFRRYERARRLAHRAYHDPLTGLANRALFFDRIGHALTLARRREELVAVALIDLDEFKLVNDSLGHGFGDSLIAAVGERLNVHARESDTVARLGGDEFAVLVEGVHSAAAVEELAARFHHVFSAPFDVQGRELRVRATIGWAVGDADSEVDELLRNADLAMYAGKRQGKDRASIFEASMHRELLERLELENELRDALDNGEMLLHYQPIVSLDSGKIVGVEALARWEHPTRGFVPPATFIPIAEQAGLIVPIGRWVLIEACRQVRRWQDEYPMHPPLMISVNVSPVQLQTPEIVSDVMFALRESGIEPSSLEIEITESVIVDRTTEFARRLEELAALGVRLAIDDFGTGYSSLSQLNHLPVDTFKIDRSFLQGVLESPDRAALLRSVIEMGHSLGLVSIAEGVEDPDEGSALRGFGCTLAQGFHFSKPLPAAAVVALLEPDAGGIADAPRPIPRPSPAL
ncbi:MAG: bifunctional diguanylate cyclase/phosphodiesterase [Gaiellales bacterium]